MPQSPYRFRWHKEKAMGNAHIATPCKRMTVSHLNYIGDKGTKIDPRSNTNLI